MVAHIIVTKKEGVFDDLGERVNRQLEPSSRVSQVKGGKYFRVEIQESDPGKGKLLIDELCKILIASSVYEQYEFSIE